MYLDVPIISAGWPYRTFINNNDHLPSTLSCVSSNDDAFDVNIECLPSDTVDIPLIVQTDDKDAYSQTLSCVSSDTSVLQSLSSPLLTPPNLSPSVDLKISNFHFTFFEDIHIQDVQELTAQISSISGTRTFANLSLSKVRISRT